MPEMDWPIPDAFNPEDETKKVLAQAKAKLSKGFKWSKAQCLYDASALAVLLHVFDRDDVALEVCRGLGRIPFDGTFSLWSAVETALTLQARVLRRRGDEAGAAECLRRVREAGFVPKRLEGGLLDPNDTVKESVKDGRKKSEQAGRLILAKELAFIIELGGSEKWPVDHTEQEWQENIARPRELTGADQPA